MEINGEEEEAKSSILNARMKIKTKNNFISFVFHFFSKISFLTLFNLLTAFLIHSQILSHSYHLHLVKSK